MPEMARRISKNEIWKIFCALNRRDSDKQPHRNGKIGTNLASAFAHSFDHVTQRFVVFAQLDDAENAEKTNDAKHVEIDAFFIPVFGEENVIALLELKKNLSIRIRLL